MVKNVYILTYCQQIENFYGTELVFKTLRTGFPTANVHVFDNASLPSVRHLIRRHAKECGASFIQIDPMIMHDEFIRKTLINQRNGSAVFVDPDVCFWESVEDWNFNALIAGRLFPKVCCAYRGGITVQPRLHTSFLQIDDVAALVKKIGDIKSQYFEFKPFSPTMFCLDGVWHRFDTAAVLYSALGQDETYAFGEKELNCFDHIFSGTHIGFIIQMFGEEYGEKFVSSHEQAKNNYTQIKGAWQWQEELFKNYAV